MVNVKTTWLGEDIIWRLLDYATANKREKKFLKRNFSPVFDDHNFCSIKFESPQKLFKPAITYRVKLMA